MLENDAFGIIQMLEAKKLTIPAEVGHDLPSWRPC